MSRLHGHVWPPQRKDNHIGARSVTIAPGPAGNAISVRLQPQGDAISVRLSAYPGSALRSLALS